MKKLFRHYLLLVVVAGGIIALDQWTKSLIRANLAIGEVLPVFDWLTPYARIVHWYNTGASFGMFQGMGGIFAILAILVSLAIIYYFPRIPDEDWTLRLAMSLQLGGAMGNLIDRLTVGHVTDFISVGNFPVFNVADSSITIGVGVLLLGVWIQERRQKQQAQAMANQSEPSAHDSARQESQPPVDELPS